MSDKNVTEQLSQLTLGKSTEYQSIYDRHLLQTVPRSLTRESLGLGDNSPLPFVGVDKWTGYEVSWLNAKGKPEVVIAEFEFPCHSDVLVESKSFKLYLNSFNQTRFNSSSQVIELMIKDLSAACGKKVSVQFFSLDSYSDKGINSFQGSVCIDDLDIDISEYDYNASLLSVNEALGDTTEKLHSHLLKSNCLITNQPDWGSIYIEYQGKALNHSALLQYIISFRSHNEFHEHCVERIYTDIHHLLKPKKLIVYARYTRRGGLDINPLRSSEPLDFSWQRLARQ